MENQYVVIVRGLVRPFIAIAITATLVVLAFMKRIEAAEFMNLALVVVTFYFAERSTLKGIEKANGASYRPPEPEPEKPPEEIEGGATNEPQNEN